MRFGRTRTRLSAKIRGREPRVLVSFRSFSLSRVAAFLALDPTTAERSIVERTTARWSSPSNGSKFGVGHQQDHVVGEGTVPQTLAVTSRSRHEGHGHTHIHLVCRCASSSKRRDVAVAVTIKQWCKKFFGKNGYSARQFWARRTNLRLLPLPNERGNRNATWAYIIKEPLARRSQNSVHICSQNLPRRCGQWRTSLFDSIRSFVGSHSGDLDYTCIRSSSVSINLKNRMEHTYTHFLQESQCTQSATSQSSSGAPQN